MASSFFPEKKVNNPFTQKPELLEKRKNRVVPRGTAQHVLERAQRLYTRQLEGKTTRSLVLEHASIEKISEVTAWTDWNKVKQWNKEDWEKDRENMLPRLQAMRIRLFNKAVKKGQFQTAAQILDSLGKVIGESVETVNIQAPELSIKVESKN